MKFLQTYTQTHSRFIALDTDKKKVSNSTHDACFERPAPLAFIKKQTGYIFVID